MLGLSSDSDFYQEIWRWMTQNENKDTVPAASTASARGRDNVGGFFLYMHLIPHIGRHDYPLRYKATNIQEISWSTANHARKNKCPAFCPIRNRHGYLHRQVSMILHCVRLILISPFSTLAILPPVAVSTCLCEPLTPQLIPTATLKYCAPYETPGSPLGAKYWDGKVRRHNSSCIKRPPTGYCISVSI